MRIDEIAIDGFGLLRDRRLAPSPGLTLVRGENEAGKSTLLAFIRAILFGFDPKSPGPLAGGRRGGWLIVTPDGGQAIRVERYGTTGGSGQLRLLDHDGNDLGADGLGRILQGVERAVYRNIFAFGLSELTEFETLTGPAIADRIYGAGMGTGATSVVEVENGLEKLRSDIFVKRGRVPRMNALLAEIDELETRLEAINPPEAFRAAGAHRATLEADLAALTSEAEAVAAERRRLERLRDGWPSWLGLEAARARFAELPARPGQPAGFAPDILERLVSVERDLTAREERSAGLREERATAIARRDGLAVDERLLTAQATAGALVAGIAEARSERTRLAEQERDLADRSAALAAALRRLGPGWDEDRVLAVDDSLAAQGTILSQFRPAIDAAERELTGAQATVARTDEDLADARAELAAIAPAGSITTLQAMGERPAPGRSGSRAIVLTWTLVGLLVGLLAAQGATLAGWVLPEAGLLGLAAGVVAALAGIWIRRSSLPNASVPDPLAGSRTARLEERTERVQLLEDRARSAAGRLLAAEHAQEDVLAGWRTWLAGHGLPADIDRETAGRLLESSAQVRAQIAGLAAVRARRDQTAASLADFESRARALLAGLGRPADDPLAGLEMIRRDLHSAVAAAVDRDRIAAELQRIDAAEVANEAAKVALSGDLAAILAEVGADNPGAVRTAVAAATRQSEVERAIQAAQDTLVALSGPGEAVSGFQADLAAVGDLARVQSELADVVERATTLEHHRTAIFESLGAERETIARIERSAESAELRQQRADRIAKLRELAESWSVTSIALALLRRTRERYEREHRPDVLRAAEELLASWTGGRYVRILAPLGKQVQELERRDGVVVPLTGLSTGTAQQLYLALRFALVDHFARQAESLPVVMDDILVNFDPVRAERAARSIEDLATRHQVLYFTCHPGTPLQAATTIELPTLVKA